MTLKVRELAVAARRQSLAWLAAAIVAAGGAASSARAFPAAAADILLQAHAKAFMRVENGRACFKEATEGEKNAPFWTQAEQLEMVLDACERTGGKREQDVFTELFNGFVFKHGEDWTSNEYNDDIMWMVIASARGYLLTGNAAMRDAARSNFDACFARSWSSDLGGGLWWKTENLSKNACVNGPGAIAAALLSRACREPSYLVKATNIFLWERATLFNEGTGQVYDNVRLSGHKSYMSLTYNQGTFVGAANLLGYTNEAMLAATFTMNRLCNQGILPAYGQTGDAGGFNGICARWIARFMKDRHAEPVFESWLRKNAEAAWNVRRPDDNLSWNDWWQPTPSETLYSWGCSSSVVMLQVIPPSAGSK